MPVRDRRGTARVLSVVCLASFMGAISSSSINIALPTIVRHFEASAFAATWLLLGAMIAGTGLMVLFGRLADTTGRRRMYLTGIGVFVGANLIAGFAPTIEVLTVCRVVQAAAGAMIVANSAALVAAAVPAQHLGRGMSFYLASFSIAQAIGPSLGGFVTEHFGWRWVFWGTVPLGLICWFWGARALDRSPPVREPFRLDVLGNLLVLMGLGSALFAVSSIPRLGLTDPGVLAGLAVFLLALPLFVFVEHRTAHPVVDLEVLRCGSVALSLLAGLLSGMVRFSLVLLVGLYFQVVAGDSPAEAGLKLLPMSVAVIVASLGAGGALSRVAPSRLALGAIGTTTLGLLLMQLVLSSTAPTWLLLLPTVVVGLGAGAFVPANSTVILSAVPTNRIGITNAVRVMAQGSGMAFGTAAALAIITIPLPSELQDIVVQGGQAFQNDSALSDLVLGYRLALVFLTVAALLSAGVTALAGRRRMVATREEQLVKPDSAERDNVP